MRLQRMMCLAVVPPSVSASPLTTPPLAQQAGLSTYRTH
jgi:hypothetical protein